MLSGACYLRSRRKWKPRGEHHGDAMSDLRRVVGASAPAYLDALDAVRRGEADVLMMTISAFVNEPELLRDALLLAHNEGVEVCMAPHFARKEASLP